MRSTPELDAKLQQRLRDAVERFAGGSADKFGRLAGYTNGGYVREVLNGTKPVREALIDRVHSHPDMAGWFDSLLTPLMAADVAAREPVRPVDADEARLVEAFRMLLRDDKAELLAEVERRAKVVAEIEDRIRAERAGSPAKESTGDTVFSSRKRRVSGS